jgi:LEA14-like dessication related protein
MQITSRLTHFIAAAVMAYTLAGCGSAIKSPQVDVAEVRLASIDREGVQFTVSLRVTNPNPIEITVTDLKADLSIAGQLLGKAETLSVKTTLSAQTAITVPMRVSVAFKALPETLRQSLIAASAGSLPYKIAGSATVANGLIQIPFEKSGEIARRR